MILRPLLVLLVLFGGLTAATAQQDPLARKFETARKFLQDYTLMEQSYNVDMAGLYHPEAVVETTVLLGDREFTNRQSGEEYGKGVRAYLPIAKNLGEYFTYSNVSIFPDGEGMRILATRTSHLTGRAFPFEILIRPFGSSGWLIVEERSIVEPGQ